MRDRSCCRMPVQCTIEFRGVQLMGGGMVLDLSEHGAKVASDKGIESGMHLMLRIYLRPDALPVKVERAMVRWVKGQEFGLEFLSMQAEERGRLQSIIHMP